MEGLTQRQERVLAAILHSLSSRGYAPSIREIASAAGLSSPSSVHYHLGQLEEMGYLRRDPTLPRAMEVLWDPETDLHRTPAASRAVPLVGEIAAGAPLVAEERVEELYRLPQDLVGEGDLFMLRVRGESMIEAGILDGDLVVVRQQPEVAQGELCAALVEGEATVKTFRRTKSGEVFLDPANPAYEPIPVPREDGSAIMGKVVAVLRRV